MKSRPIVNTLTKYGRRRNKEYGFRPAFTRPGANLAKTTRHATTFTWSNVGMRKTGNSDWQVG